MSRWRAIGLGCVGAVGLAALGLHTAPLPERLFEPGSPELTWDDGTTAWVGLAPDDRWRMPVTLDDVDPDYVDALLRIEDKRFHQHPGVDPIALSRAVGQNLSRGSVVSGASTITMQLVRVLEPRPRTLQSKAVEAVRALSLETQLSKEEILEAYLTFTPFGGNIEGVEAASWAYFGHSAKELTEAEITTLLAVPQNPNARKPSPGHADRLRGARDDLASRLGWTLEDAAVPTHLRRFPREIPHVAAWLRPGAEVNTQLDHGLQRTAERLVATVRHERGLQGIDNIAVVVVEHSTGEVKALVGGYDFWDPEHGGQIPAFANPRSPGSALKPFLYAQAIDDGHALPEHLVTDIPRAWGDYVPDNYDGRFDGLVRLEESLSRSLNLPFVDLLGRIGVPRFVGILDGAGVDSLSDDPGFYGLSIAAGGIELTPLELAGLYATLANDGVYNPLQVTVSAEEEASVRVWSPGASWLTARALRLRDRPDFPSRRHLARLPRNVAWKTGTSFGHRDAWAAGSAADHTVVVWLGNLDNRPSAWLVGAEAAGPVLFDLLEALDEAADVPAPPQDLVSVEVCADTGHLPTDACEHRTTVLARGASVPTHRCPYHVQVDVDVATGLAVGPGCRDGSEWETRSYLRWPTSVRRFLRARHRVLPEVPAPSPGCSADDSRAPVIVNPGPGQVAMLMPGVPAENQEIPLEADAIADAALTWFVDGAHVGTARPHERVWWTPSPGTHALVVVDPAGRSTRRVFEVR